MYHYCQYHQLQLLLHLHHDLQWYQAVRQSNGDWSYTVNLSQHRDKGTYFIHVYGNTRQNLVAHTTAYVS